MSTCGPTCPASAPRIVSSIRCATAQTRRPRVLESGSTTLVETDLYITYNVVLGPSSPGSHSSTICMLFLGKCNYSFPFLLCVWRHQIGAKNIYKGDVIGQFNSMIILMIQQRSSMHKMILSHQHLLATSLNTLLRSTWFIGLLCLTFSRTATGGSCAAYLKCDTPGDDECRDLAPMFGPGTGGVQVGGKVTPLDGPTKEGLCQHYSSGSCCSAKFIDTLVWPEYRKHVADITDPRCIASLQRVVCFLCDPAQSSFLEAGLGKDIRFDFDICDSGEKAPHVISCNAPSLLNDQCPYL